VQGIDCRLSEGDSDSVETCSGEIICEIIACFCWFRVENKKNRIILRKRIEIAYLFRIQNGNEQVKP